MPCYAGPRSSSSAATVLARTFWGSSTRPGSVRSPWRRMSRSPRDQIAPGLALVLVGALVRCWRRQRRRDGTVVRGVRSRFKCRETVNCKRDRRKVRPARPNGRRLPNGLLNSHSPPWLADALLLVALENTAKGETQPELVPNADSSEVNLERVCAETRIRAIGVLSRRTNSRRRSS
jgi:hypothetical protein